ncbi:hypothetical protein ACOSQ3_027312 [Xanthoceras sorbifolium]
MCTTCACCAHAIVALVVAFKREFTQQLFGGRPRRQFDKPWTGEVGNYRTGGNLDELGREVSWHSARLGETWTSLDERFPSTLCAAAKEKENYHSSCWKKKARQQLVREKKELVARAVAAGKRE